MSTSGTGQVDAAQMIQVANSIGSPTGGGIAQEISTQLSNLEQTLEALAPQWQSEAASAFYQVNATWHEEAQAVNQALTAIAEGLLETAAAYQKMTADSMSAVRASGQA
jgi:WXG100 family type VII secretion target